MERLSHVLRSVAIALVIVGCLFKIQHWPYAVPLFIVAWVSVLLAFVLRLGSGQLLHILNAKNTFSLGIISYVVLRMLHWPGTQYALGVTLIGGIAWLWFRRDIYTTKGPKPILFYGAIVLVVLGMLFRIQHWPYSSTLLIIGLVIAAAWFFSPSHSDDNTQP